MSDLGDIGSIIDDQPVTDLDWLDVDEEEYRASEKLPQQNLDAVPELEAQWSKLTEADKYRLSPENRAPRNPKTPFWSERRVPGEITGEDAVAIVEKFAKRHVQAGVKGRDLIDILKRNFDSNVLSMSKDAVRSVLEERGLLGSVYIDSELFDECYKGGPVKGLTANTKPAKYVLGKTKCNDCIHNREGRCSVFQKEIVFDVQYTDTLWNEYEERLQMEGKDIERLKGLPVKARLQKALLASPMPSPEALDGKPIVAAPANEISYEEALGQLRSADIKQEIVANLRVQRKQERLAYAMMQGNHGPFVRDLIASDPDLAPLENELHILGNLYLDLSYFATHKIAATFMESLETVPPIVVGTPYDESDTKQAQATTFDIRSAKSLQHVISRYFLVKFGHKMDDKKQKQADRLFVRLQKTPEDKVWRFAQGVYKSPVPQKVREYEAAVIYDPTEGITSEEADQQLKAAAKRERLVVQSPQKVANKKDLVGRMLRGDHGTRVSTIIEQDVRLRDLRSHLHLLGNLYVDTRLAMPQDVEAAAAANPMVKELPLLTPNNEDGFFAKPEVHARIARRVAAVKGIEEGPAYTKFLRTMVAKFGEAPEEKVLAIARKAFATPIKNKVAIHDMPYRIRPDMNVTEEQVQTFMDSMANKKRARAFNTLEDYLTEEGGPELLESLQNRIGLDRIKKLYLTGDGKVAANLKASKTAKQDAMEILSAVLSDNYKPSGIKPPTKRMSNTKVGKFLRDQLMKGKSGKELASALKTAFSYAELLDQAPIIIAFREEEGLYGRTYSTADSYANCHEGTQKVGSSIQQVVKGSKCDGCIYNKIGRCLLYSKDLVESPVYNETSVEAALRHRIANGQLTERDARQVMQMDLDPKTKTRLAHTAVPSTAARMHETGLQAYYGDRLEKSVDHAVVQKAISKKEKAEKEAISQMDTSHSSEGGTSGADQMEEFELGSRAVETAADFEINEGPAESTMDVEFGGGLTIE